MNQYPFYTPYPLNLLNVKHKKTHIYLLYLSIVYNVYVYSFFFTLITYIYLGKYRYLSLSHIYIFYLQKNINWIRKSITHIFGFAILPVNMKWEMFPRWMLHICDVMTYTRHKTPDSLNTCEIGLYISIYKIKTLCMIWNC